MSKPQQTNIYYFICQDKDNQQQPNLFTIPIHKHSIKLAHIYQYFPIKGTYIFRFKFTYEGFIVWLDLNDPEIKIPTFKQRIYVKVNRISWNQQPRKNQLLRNHSIKVQSKPQKKQQFNLFDHHQQKSAINAFNPSYSSPQTLKSNENNLLGGYGLTNFSNPPSKQLNLLGQFHHNNSSTAKVQINLSNPSKHGDLI